MNGVEATGRPAGGRLAAAVGVLIGAHVGTVPGGIIGTLAYVPFVRPGGGGFDVLIGSFFGALGGVVAGGALGAYLALRLRRHAGPARTAAVAAGLLLVGLVPFFLLLRAGSDATISGGWYGVAFEAPLLLVAALVRRLPLTNGR